MPGQVTKILQDAQQGRKEKQERRGWRGEDKREVWMFGTFLKQFLYLYVWKKEISSLKVAQDRGISMNKLFIFPQCPWDPPPICGFQFTDFRWQIQVAQIHLNISNMD